MATAESEAASRGPLNGNGVVTASEKGSVPSSDTGAVQNPPAEGSPAQGKEPAAEIPAITGTERDEVVVALKTKQEPAPSPDRSGSSTSRDEAGSEPQPQGEPTPRANSGAADDVDISDYYFIRDLKRLKDLRAFFLQEAIALKGPDGKDIDFGDLMRLRSPAADSGHQGRVPRKDEWAQVAQLTQTLFCLMSDPQRKKFLLGEFPKVVMWETGAFLAIAVGALVIAVISYDPSASNPVFSNSRMLLYIFWLVFLGAIGSVAFIGMNALSVQQDATFDMNNGRLLQLRIILGALFGLVLTLPFGYDGFTLFIESVAKHSASATAASATAASGAGSNSAPPLAPNPLSTSALIMLLPFVFGFSTSLVIMVLNRLIEGGQAFFGKPSSVDARSPATSGRGSSPFS